MKWKRLRRSKRLKRSTRSTHLKPVLNFYELNRINFSKELNTILASYTFYIIFSFWQTFSHMTFNFRYFLFSFFLFVKFSSFLSSTSSVTFTYFYFSSFFQSCANTLSLLHDTIVEKLYHVVEQFKYLFFWIVLRGLCWNWT